MGAGASGLVALKELLAEGHEAEAFEATKFVGGAFSVGGAESSANRSYESLYLTISNYYMAFSDFPPKDEWRFWKGIDYAHYLLDYAKHFGLLPHITFEARVTWVERNADQQWSVTIQHANGKKETRLFDAVAVSIGSHQNPNIPKIEGIESFKGSVDHSWNFYNDISKFRDRKMVVVGIGETASDLVREVSNVSKSCDLVVRKYPFCIPRLLADGHPNDVFTGRLFYPNLDDNIFVWLWAALIFVFVWFPLSWTRWAYPYQQWRGADPSDPSTTNCMGANRLETQWMDENTVRTKELVHLMAKWHGHENSSWINKSVTKNITFMTNVLNGKIEVHRGCIARATSHSVILDDGSEIECDGILFCTGYRDDFSFLAPNLRPPNNDVRSLFYHAFHPTVGSDLVFIGMARPTSGAIPGCSELVARYFALLQSGRRRLPTDIEQQAVKDREREERIFTNSPNLRALVNPFDYFDGLAKLIGCYQSPWAYWNRPLDFWRYMVGLNGLARYRIVGPHACPKQSEEWLKRYTFPLPHPGSGVALLVKLFWCLGYTNGDFVVWLRRLGVEPTLALGLPFNGVAPSVL